MFSHDVSLASCTVLLWRTERTLVLFRCELPSDVDFLQMWTSFRCGLLSDVDFLQMRTSFRCGLLSDVDFLHMWTSFRCGLPSDVDFLQMWTSFICGLPSDVDFLHMWTSFRCGLPSDLAWSPQKTSAVAKHLSFRKQDNSPYLYNVLKFISFLISSYCSKRLPKMA